MGTFPVIDYTSHPGFSGLDLPKEDLAADAMIADIETAYTALCEDAVLTSEQRIRTFEREVEPQIDALLQHLGQTAEPQFHRFTINAFKSARQSMREYLAVRASSRLTHNSAQQSLSSADLNQLENFRRDGFAVVQDAALARDVWSSTWLERALLRSRKRKAPNRHCAMSLPMTSPGYATVKRAAEKLGLRKLAESYIGKPMEFHYAALDHAHDGQDWYQSCYGDKGINTAKTVYMHFDADCDIIKAMLYLKDVEDRDGPFSFVTGSHHWERPRFATAVQRGFDAASNEEFPLTEDRLDYLSGYYRPRFKLAEYRRNHLSLPAALRGSTHFGDDLLDGSHLSSALLEQEHVFTGPAGTVVMFDGSHGIHRGGQTKEGSRWAVQIAFRVSDNKARRSVNRRILRFVKHKLLRIRDVFRGLKQLQGAA
jgi:hypothetical protein